MPLHLQDSPHFEFLRNYLQAAGFNEKLICERLTIKDTSELVSRGEKPTAPALGSDSVGLLVRLLLLGESLEREGLESNLSSRFVEALESLGLASPDPADSRRLYCEVALYPADSLIIVSDRWFPLAGKEVRNPEDFVYPAITPNTRTFLTMLPITPCDSFLELCSGAGAAALAASKYANKSWAIDITERSAQMAEFNRRLNGLDNVTVLKGNLYEGVEELQFDRIAAHPPYMPALRTTRTFADGGADGEQVTRGIIEALPRFLKPGGAFYCLAQASDRKGAPLPQRVRGWLGEGHSDFDVAFVQLWTQEPKDAAFTYAIKTGGGFEAVALMSNSLASNGVESLPYGWIVIQRRSNTRNVFTVRRTVGRPISHEEIAWLLGWETFAAGPSAFSGLLEKVPVARNELAFHINHRLHEGKLVPEQFTLRTEAPFPMESKVQYWIGFLLPLCDGKSTVRQLCETCKSNKFILPDTPPQEFAKLVGALISGGFLEIADFPLPNPLQGQTPTSASLDL